MDRLPASHTESLLTSTELGSIMNQVQNALSGNGGKDLAVKIGKVLDGEEFRLPNKEETGEISQDLLGKCDEMSSLLIQLNTIIFSANNEERKAITDFLQTLAMRNKLVGIKIDQITKVIEVINTRPK